MKPRVERALQGCGPTGPPTGAKSAAVRKDAGLHGEVGSDSEYGDQSIWSTLKFKNLQ